MFHDSIGEQFAHLIPAKFLYDWRPIKLTLDKMITSSSYLISFLLVLSIIANSSFALSSRSKWSKRLAAEGDQDDDSSPAVAQTEGSQANQNEEGSAQEPNEPKLENDPQPSDQTNQNEENPTTESAEAGLSTTQISTTTINHGAVLDALEKSNGVMNSTTMNVADDPEDSGAVKALNGTTQQKNESSTTTIDYGSVLDDPKNSGGVINSTTINIADYPKDSGAVKALNGTTQGQNESSGITKNQSNLKNMSASDSGNSTIPTSTNNGQLNESTTLKSTNTNQSNGTNGNSTLSSAGGGAKSSKNLTNPKDSALGNKEKQNSTTGSSNGANHKAGPNIKQQNNGNISTSAAVNCDQHCQECMKCVLTPKVNSYQKLHSNGKIPKVRIATKIVEPTVVRVKDHDYEDDDDDDNDYHQYNDGDDDD